MIVRRVCAGIVLAGALLGIVAPVAVAAPNVVPTLQDVGRTLKDLRPTPPAVGVPTLDPQNPQLPSLPYVEVPPGLRPALGVLSPAGVTTCQAAYLGPLGGAVLMTMVLDQLPENAVPVQPSLLSPLFGPVTTACAVAPYPRWTACDRDAAIQQQSDAVPAPFASLVVEIDAAQELVSYYALNREPFGRDIAASIAKRLGCQ